MNKFLVIVLTVLFCMISLHAQQYSYDYEEMTMDEYHAELSKWQQREQAANAEITECEARVSSLQQDIAAAEADFDNTWNEIYAMLDTDKGGYDDFTNQCKALESSMNGLVSLSPEDIYTRRSEVEAHKETLASLQADKRSLGPDPYMILSRVESLIAQAEEKMKPTHDSYTVNNGDYLWRIARDGSVYGDGYQWIKIYTANRAQISNPDLIYPNQVFRIPRVEEPNEYWVQSGDNLSSIAGARGNVFTWQGIYEANKDVVSDANLIYPHMILTIP